MGTVIFVYAMFFVGYLLHMGLQVDAVVRAKNNAAVSRLSVMKDNWIVLLARLFISVIVFWFLRAHPQFLGTLVGYLGITLSPGLGSSLNAESWGIAGMFGFTMDTILAFIPVLKNFVPQFNDAVAVSVSTTTQPGTQPVTTTTVTGVVAPPKP